MTRVAVIPARGGSKRIPGKNIRIFAGKPMIGWSIEAARQSGCMDRILVSTESPEVARIAIDCGAEVPFMRPVELADDHTGTGPVMAHAVEWLRRSGVQPTSVCCIYATAPFLRPGDLRDGLGKLESAGCDFTFSVTSYAFPIQRAILLTPGGRAKMFQPQHLQTRSQDLEPAYHDAAQFYWGRAEAWREQRPIFSPASIPVVLPRHRVQDIDTPDDWERAALMFQVLQQQAFGG
jgi:N-acylneuraminate cytidylyltransferase